MLEILLFYFKMLHGKEDFMNKGGRAMSRKRFEIVHSQGTFDVYKVIRDNETGVLYMESYSGTGIGLTVMVDQDGKPLLDEDFRK